jgi:hypothetical protein
MFDQALQGCMNDRLEGCCEAWLSADCVVVKSKRIPSYHTCDLYPLINSIQIIYFQIIHQKVRPTQKYDGPSIKETN